MTHTSATSARLETGRLSCTWFLLRVCAFYYSLSLGSCRQACQHCLMRTQKRQKGYISPWDWLEGS